jgi:hypothetical protein
VSEPSTAELGLGQAAIELVEKLEARIAELEAERCAHWTCGGLSSMCTPGERKVLEAMAGIRFTSRREPIAQYSEVLPALEAELARREEGKS